uniref:Uncharacterized protein n=1 Tax=Romanomermis culicivorax TaxID=13658 RepID=A0A915JXL4_ROMCU
MQYAVLPQAAGGDVYVTSYPHAAAAAAYPHLMRSASLTGNGAIYAGQQQQPQQICQQQQSTN